MDLELFRRMLSIDSTSSKETALAEFLSRALLSGKNRLETCEVGDGTTNLLFSWGEPEVFFCTHMDTVPPFIPPTFPGTFSPSSVISGRGTCDAKGQIFSMFTACKMLEDQGKDGFALLLLSGEETGSFGAKAFRETHPGGDLVVVGEPTDNAMASASKGTKSYALSFCGEPCHSGYPSQGRSAVDLFVDFASMLKEMEFPKDEILGDTTWNFGKVSSPNPQNILSPELTCRLYFRTTFASDALVCSFMEDVAAGRKWKGRVTVEAFGGDTPQSYTTMKGFKTAPVAFGSDAPQLHNFRRKILCGPGSILDAHTPGEKITLGEITEAVDNYVKIYNYRKEI